MAGDERQKRRGEEDIKEWRSGRVPTPLWLGLLAGSGAVRWMRVGDWSGLTSEVPEWLIVTREPDANSPQRPWRVEDSGRCVLKWAAVQAWDWMCLCGVSMCGSYSSEVVY